MLVFFLFLSISNVSDLHFVSCSMLVACYDNFCKSNECIALYSRFDITTGASFVEIRDTVFNKFYCNVAAR